MSPLKCCLSVFSCSILWANHLSNFHFSYIRIFFRIGVAREYSKVIGGLLSKGKALSGNKQKLAREFCVVAREYEHPTACLLFKAERHRDHV